MPRGRFRGVVIGGPPSTYQAPRWLDPKTLLVTSALTLRQTQGSGILYALGAAGSPDPIITYAPGYSASDLPPGITVTGLLTNRLLIGGTTSTSGTYTIQFRAQSRDDAGTLHTATLTLTITLDPRVIVDESTYIPSNIDKTGATDVSVALQRFFDSCPDGTPSSPTIIRLPANAVYRIENVMLLREWKNWILDGHLAPTGGFIANTDGSGVSIPLPDNVLTRSQFDLFACENFSIYQVNVRGANPVTDYRLDAIYQVNKETQHAFRFRGCLDFEVSGGAAKKMKLSRTYGDAMYFGWGQKAGGGHRLCARAYVHDVEVAQTGRQGFSPCGIADSVFEDGYNHHNGRASIDFEPIGTPAFRGGSDPATFGVFNTHVIGWTFGPHRLFTIAHKGSGLTDGLVLRNLIGETGSDCQLKMFAGSSDFNDGSPGEQRYNLYLLDSDFPGNGTQFATGGGHGAIQIQRYTGVCIARNNIPVQNRNYVRESKKVGGVTVYDPLYVAGREPLVQAAYCTDVRVESNTDNGAPQVRPSWEYTDTAYNPSTTAPAAPVCGPTFARRATGGWTP